MENIAPSNPIRAKKANRTRDLNYLESLSLMLGALGTLSLTRGLKITNAILNDRQVAIVIIENARFGKDGTGTTTLSDVIDVKIFDEEYANG